VASILGTTAVKQKHEARRFQVPPEVYNDWIERDAYDAALPVSGDVSVDVLYEDEAIYMTLAAGCVEWSRSANAVVLWRLSHVDSRQDYEPKQGLLNGYVDVG
jgi:hypothetical protein